MATSGITAPGFRCAQSGLHSKFAVEITMSHVHSQAGPAQARSTSLVMMDARALASAIRARDVSCVEVMTTYLDHIERINPHVNAIVALRDRAALLAEAREKDAQLARGDATGPLHGLPFAVKDLVPVKGIRTTSGSLLFKDFVPAAD